jgi:hypothetical protein
MRFNPKEKEEQPIKRFYHDMSIIDWREHLKMMAAKGMIPVFFRPSNSCPVASYIWKDKEHCYDTGKQILYKNTVTPEYTIKVY